MQDERWLTLRQADQARGDLYAISDDLEFLKEPVAQRHCQLVRPWSPGAW